MSKQIVKSVKLMLAIKLAAFIFVIGYSRSLAFCFVIYAVVILPTYMAEKFLPFMHIPMLLCRIAILLTGPISELSEPAPNIIYATVSLIATLIIFLLPLDLFCREKKVKSHDLVQKTEPLIVDAEIVDD